jgi:hypothetical protein
VPWCATCDRFLSPSSVRTDGACPSCGKTVDAGAARAPITVDDEELDPIPWHFKLLLGAFAVYLGYRAFQGIEWLAGQL